MTDHEQLVKALRSASTVSTAWEKLMHDAAAAIEALQAELEKKRTAECWGCKCEKVEPKRGEWRLVTPDSYIFNVYRCSLCNEPVYGMTNYCPNCGAKMNGEQNVE